MARRSKPKSKNNGPRGRPKAKAKAKPKPKQREKAKPKPKPKRRAKRSYVRNERTTVYFYPELHLFRELQKQLAKQQKCMASLVTPRRGPLSRSAYIASILGQFFHTKTEYDKTSSGGWAGYWSMVREAIDQKAKEGQPS